MDSATLLSVACNKYRPDQVIAVGFDYGQRHVTELNYARDVAEWFKVRFKVVSLPRIFAGGSSALMMDTPVEIIGSYTDLASRYGGQPTIVPGRNLNFLAMCATIAEVNRLNRVWIANHAGDADNWHYFDCTPEFIAGAQSAIGVGTGFAVTLEAPFTFKTKAELVTLAHENQAPLHLTQSCYNGQTPACGECATCTERLQAFLTAGYFDPIDYQKLPEWYLRQGSQLSTFSQ
ncbi:MAG: hypothetical protein HC888_04125 [Candidatus Competibacteraceae bacterium]|nr:hypothetical protein [Candidatus Competibacteraceae bacterium]